MNGLQLLLSLYGLLAILLCVVFYTDGRHRIIPNWLNLVIAALAPVMWVVSGMAVWPDMVIQLGIGLGVFAIFAGIFALGGIGGGDVKLLGALGLWFPLVQMGQLLLAMALIGGALTIVLSMWHLMRRAKDKLKIPYGIAIALAGLLTIYERYLNQFAGL